MFTLNARNYTKSSISQILNPRVDFVCLNEHEVEFLRLESK